MDKRSQIQREALVEILNNKRAGVNISMGVGKTRIAIQDIAVNNYRKILVVIPKLSIKDSWIKELEKLNRLDLLQRITFTTYISLQKHPLHYYDKLYFDECHNLTEKNYDFLKEHLSNLRVLGLTGTYPDKGMKKKICDAVCPEVYSYTIEDAIRDKVLNNYRIYIHRIPLSKKNDFVIKTKRGSFKTSELKSYMYWEDKIKTVSDEFRARIGRLASMKKYNSKIRYINKLLKNNNTNDKKIIFVGTKEQANTLPNPIHSGISKEESTKILKRFIDGEIDTITTIEQMSEGTTVPNLKVAIISHAYSNNRKLAQKIGRVLRLNPNDECRVHIICYKHTVDEDWVSNALSTFDPARIKVIEF